MLRSRSTWSRYFNKNHVFWIVRELDASKPGGWNDVIEPPGMAEPFVRMFLDPTGDIDFLVLESEILQRFALYADDEPGQIPWLFRRDGSYRSMACDVQRECLQILEEPKTTHLDNHTMIFIWLCKCTVHSGREKSILVRDVKMPFPKMRLPKDPPVDAIWGLEFALSDEFFADGPTDIEIDFGIVQKTALKLVSKLGMVDEPAWFTDEFEGIVHMESLMRKLLPPPLTPFKELSSDKAMSDLAFSSIGQLYIVHQTAWHRNSAAYRSGTPPRGEVPCAYPGELPSDTEYVIDLSVMSKYEVRGEFAKYGAAAFFDRHRTLIAVYVCDIDGAGQPAFPIGGPRGAALVRPSRLGGESESAWEFAKWALRCTLVSFCTLRDHLCWCHWLVSNRVCIAAREELGHEHPLRRVLTMFTFRTATINYVSASTLMAENMLLHRASAFTIAGMTDGFKDCVANFIFKPFPEEMAGKAMSAAKGPTLPLPLEQDGMLVYHLRNINVLIKTMD